MGDYIVQCGLESAAETVLCFLNNSLGNEFNMCGKEKTYICVVVRHVAWPSLTERDGSSLSLVKDETLSHIW